MAKRLRSSPPRSRGKNAAASLAEARAQLARQCLEAREASHWLAASSDDLRRRGLVSLAEALLFSADDILFKNGIDVEAGRKSGLPEALLDRLTLTRERLGGMAQGLREMADLPDPLGEVVWEARRPDGLEIKKVRVPLGVVAMIYEARPNVTLESAGLCFRSGNAVVLKGGREALNSNTALVHMAQRALAETGVPAGCIQFISSTDRSLVRDLVQMDAVIDLVIPRGGETLIRAIREMATVPVLAHGRGLCAVYVDSSANPAMAWEVAYNAKVQRPGVCNAMETLLVHRSLAEKFLPEMVRRYQAAGVEVRGDPVARRWGGARVVRAEAKDWETEFSSLVVAVKVVESVEEAVDHINRHGSHHSDAIVASDPRAVEYFLNRVDSAAVFHNASTRLHDGGVFGLGSEMGISTQKLHARGSMGLKELTTTKYVVRGDGHLRE